MSTIINRNQPNVIEQPPPQPAGQPAIAQKKPGQAEQLRRSEQTAEVRGTAPSQQAATDQISKQNTPQAPRAEGQARAAVGELSSPQQMAVALQAFTELSALCGPRGAGEVATFMQVSTGALEQTSAPLPSQVMSEGNSRAAALSGTKIATGAWQLPAKMESRLMAKLALTSGASGAERSLVEHRLSQLSPGHAQAMRQAGAVAVGLYRQHVVGQRRGPDGQPQNLLRGVTSNISSEGHRRIGGVGNESEQGLGAEEGSASSASSTTGLNLVGGGNPRNGAAPADSVARGSTDTIDEASTGAIHGSDVEIPSLDLVKLEKSMFSQLSLLQGSMDIDSLVQMVMMQCAADSEKDLKDLILDMQAINAKKQALRDAINDQKKQKADVEKALRDRYEERCKLPATNPLSIDRNQVSFDEYSAGQRVLVTRGSFDVGELDGTSQRAPLRVELSANEVQYPRGITGTDGVQISPADVVLARQLQVEPELIPALRRIYQSSTPEVRAELNSFERWLVAAPDRGGAGLAAAPNTSQSTAARAVVAARDPSQENLRLASTFNITASDLQSLREHFLNQLTPQQRTALGGSFENFLGAAAPVGPGLTRNSPTPQREAVRAFLNPPARNETTGGSGGVSSAVTTPGAHEAFAARAREFGVQAGEMHALRDFYNTLPTEQRNALSGSNADEKFQTWLLSDRPAGPGLRRLSSPPQSSAVASFFAHPPANPTDPSGPLSNGQTTAELETALLGATTGQLGYSATELQQQGLVRELRERLPGAGGAAIDLALAEYLRCMALGAHDTAHGSDYGERNNATNARNALREAINRLPEGLRGAANNYVRLRMAEVVRDSRVSANHNGNHGRSESWMQRTPGIFNQGGDRNQPVGIYTGAGHQWLDDDAWRQLGNAAQRAISDFPLSAPRPDPNTAARQAVVDGFRSGAYDTVTPPPAEVATAVRSFGISETQGQALLTFYNTLPAGSRPSFDAFLRAQPPAGPGLSGTDATANTAKIAEFSASIITRGGGSTISPATPAELPTLRAGLGNQANAVDDKIAAYLLSALRLQHELADGGAATRDMPRLRQEAARAKTDLQSLVAGLPASLREGAQRYIAGVLQQFKREALASPRGTATSDDDGLVKDISGRVAYDEEWDADPNDLYDNHVVDTSLHSSFLNSRDRRTFGASAYDSDIGIGDAEQGDRTYVDPAAITAVLAEVDELTAETLSAGPRPSEAEVRAAQELVGPALPSIADENNPCNNMPQALNTDERMLLANLRGTRVMARGAGEPELESIRNGMPGNPTLEEAGRYYRWLEGNKVGPDPCPRITRAIVAAGTGAPAASGAAVGATTAEAATGAATADARAGTGPGSRATNAAVRRGAGGGLQDLRDTTTRVPESITPGLGTSPGGSSGPLLLNIGGEILINEVLRQQQEQARRARENPSGGSGAATPPGSGTPTPPASRQSDAALDAAEQSLRVGVERGMHSGAAATDGEMSMAQMQARIDDTVSRKDSLSEMGEMMSLRLQMYQERRGKFFATLSNIMKKNSDIQSGIISNLK